MSNDEVYAAQAKRRAEMMDALHAIGRNIAQQDSVHRSIANAIDVISMVLMSFGGVFVVLAMVAIAAVLQ